MAAQEIHYQYFYQNHLTLYFTEDELRNVGPVDAQVRLEEMSWNQG
jgi:hypothetical protein